MYGALCLSTASSKAGAFGELDEIVHGTLAEGLVLVGVVVLGARVAEDEHGVADSVDGADVVGTDGADVRSRGAVVR